MYLYLKITGLLACAMLITYFGCQLDHTSEKIAFYYNFFFTKKTIKVLGLSHKHAIVFLLLQVDLWMFY